MTGKALAFDGRKCFSFAAYFPTLNIIKRYTSGLTHFRCFIM
ncbi:hypothetical protein CSC02_2146 [Enterobacter hormaechei subsp. hoffmannii]|nr:hypothetical protein CSC02_2146 [Enterobacter hormaechei subsp. hoffmannii]